MLAAWVEQHRLILYTLQMQAWLDTCLPQYPWLKPTAGVVNTILEAAGVTPKPDKQNKGLILPVPIRIMPAVTDGAIPDFNAVLGKYPMHTTSIALPPSALVDAFRMTKCCFGQPCTHDRKVILHIMTTSADPAVKRYCWKAYSITLCC